MNDWLRHVDSATVLWGQMIIYTIYCLVIICVIAWIASRLTKDASVHQGSPKVFYTWIAFLVVIGVSLHVITYNTIPWVRDDLAGTPVDAAHTFKISIANQRWDIPGGQLQVPCNELVEFSVQSLTAPDNPDQPALTYGFGIFRPDHTMVAQMQVVPGHENNLLWTFNSPGSYSIRSTEYSGPAGYDILAKDAIVVSGCK